MGHPWYTDEQIVDRGEELYEQKLRPRVETDENIGKIISIDRFGNLISNITARQVREFRAANGQTVEIHIGTYIINELVGSYSQGSRRTPSALINSSGSLEIFLQEASATQNLQVGVGEEVRLC